METVGICGAGLIGASWAQLAPINPAPQIPTVSMIITSEKKTASK